MPGPSKISGSVWSTEKDSSQDADIIASSADVSAFLQMLPLNSSCFDKDPDSHIRRDAYQSSSGQSSPLRDEEDVAAPAAASSDLNFHVDDIEMWEVLEALDVPALTAAEPAAELSTIKDVAASCSPAATPSRMASISPVMSAVQTAAKAASGVKRPLPVARAASSVATAAASAVDMKLEGELNIQPLGSGKAGKDEKIGGDGTAAEEGAGDSGVVDPLEEKRLKRMRRNRESAAMSRNRKKAYIEELEAKVAALKASVLQLQNENLTLRQECTGFKSGMSSANADAREVQSPRISSAATSSDIELSLEPLAPVGEDLSLVALHPLASNQDEDKKHGAPKKVGTAGLALMSALTFVTLSANSSSSLWSRSPGHSPGSRALMSFSDEPLRQFNVEEPLWPAIDTQQHTLYETPEPYAAALTTARPTPTPVVALPTPEPAVTALRQIEQDAAKEAGRVLMLPRNSSWADALRVEAAEKQLMVRGSGRVPDGSLLGSPPPQYSLEASSAEVYEPTWKAEEEFYDDFDLSAEAEAARRFIFCARAYTFDVSSSRRNRQTPATASPPVAAAPSRELSLPAMPARFRHGASHSFPQLTDGHSGGNESEPLPLPTSRYPVVSMLLPSAALRGVVSGLEEDVGPGMARDPNALGGELMQVSCQVLNASRWGGS